MARRADVCVGSQATAEVVGSHWVACGLGCRGVSEWLGRGVAGSGGGLVP